MNMVEKYFRRLDDHVETLPPDERRRFLEIQRAGWEERYSRFCDPDYEPPAGSTATAFDYVTTIAGISARISSHA